MCCYGNCKWNQWAGAIVCIIGTFCHDQDLHSFSIGADTLYSVTALHYPALSIFESGADHYEWLADTICILLGVAMTCHERDSKVQKTNAIAF